MRSLFFAMLRLLLSSSLPKASSSNIPPTLAWKGYLNAMIAIYIQTNNLLAEKFHRMNFMGEDLDSLSLKELQSLEHQLDAAIKSIRSRKNQAMFESISALQKKDKALQDHNNSLLKKIKEREKKTGQQEGQLIQCSNSSSVLLPQYCVTSSRDGFVERVGGENGSAPPSLAEPNSLLPAWMLRPTTNE
ncbi:unnamed protein product [Arabis nemorensis]|uniref:K-box domain-containing protein n=1 Tax=Arabis nemorensis TaxID=586526 RepID=A0A565CVV8_9BRAS|nr:unnamed protein product [Arabis nemorensis]